MHSLFLLNRRSLAAVVLSCTALAGISVHAQRYPSKPIKIVVPFAAGGAVDAVARIVGQRLAEQLNQPVIVDNKPGGHANIAPISSPSRHRMATRCCSARTAWRRT